ncbi:ATP-dependent DNA helicase Hel308 [Candidatus Norongarragalina meridionalis]|nr:ATP-dependent DNA helicase Hel308 [Candidatus Norongarragalina meridionalis]
MELQEQLQKLGYESLNPLQKQAISEGLLEEERVVVSAPTASGKTLLALLSILAPRMKKKAVYVVPLRALASEKHTEFKQSLEPLGFSVGVSTGDLDSSSEQLAAYDVVVVTSEKMDSLLRHGAPWIKDVGLAVVDEVHVLNDASRGATLEIVITKLLGLGCKLLCLSATIPNAYDIAKWLDAKLILSTYRPTPLKLGVCDGKSVHFDAAKVAAEDEHDLVRLALSEKQGAQALVFVYTRRNAETLADELRKTTKAFLSEEEKEECALLAEKALKALGQPTSQCHALADCLKDGVAFHHAGICNRQRELIERGFKKDRCVKAIVCTTTLAMGIDYPASWVIVRDLKRFNGAFSEFIPALEVAQMTGRAGRPRYDDKGVGVLCCAPKDREAVIERYIFGKPEDIFSKLSSEPVLRSHCLGLISSSDCNDFPSLFGFFERTFYAHQYGDISSLCGNVERVVELLKELDFVRQRGDSLVATPVGKRVAELYIDPLSASEFIDFIGKKETGVFDALLAINSATEAKPLVSLKRGEEQTLWEEAYALFEEFPAHDHEILEKYKSAKLLNAWINESGEEDVLTEFQIPPGVLHSRMRNMEWLAYAMQEIAFMLNASFAYKNAKILRTRIKHGIKEELLPLCKMRGIGRVRARRLWNSGIKTPEAFEARSKDELKAILAGKTKA